MGPARRACSEPPPARVAREVNGTRTTPLKLLDCESGKQRRAAGRRIGGDFQHQLSSGANGSRYIGSWYVLIKVAPSSGTPPGSISKAHRGSRAIAYVPAQRTSENGLVTACWIAGSV
jgi:hypothetical protein